MQQATIAGVLDQSIQRENDYRIYLVRDGESVIYVGQSPDIYNSLESHLGMDGSGKKSVLGNYVFANVPHSRDWMIELYSIEDCEQITVAHMKSIGGTWYTKELYYSTGGAGDLAEQAMKAIHHPFLNTTYNFIGEAN